MGFIGRVVCLAVAATPVLGGCGATQGGTRACPESTALPCLTQTDCEYDEERDCRLCLCRPGRPPPEEDPCASRSVTARCDSL